MTSPSFTVYSLPSGAGDGLARALLALAGDIVSYAMMARMKRAQVSMDDTGACVPLRRLQRSMHALPRTGVN